MKFLELIATLGNFAKVAALKKSREKSASCSSSFDVPTRFSKIEVRGLGSVVFFLYSSRSIDWSGSRVERRCPPQSCTFPGAGPLYSSKRTPSLRFRGKKRKNLVGSSEAQISGSLEIPDRVLTLIMWLPSHFRATHRTPNDCDMTRY